MSSTSQGLTPEFTLLGVNPRMMTASGAFWKPPDSVGWALMMAPDLGGNRGNEFARLSALKMLDTPSLWQLFPPYPGEQPLASADLPELYRQLGVFNQGAHARSEATNVVAKKACRTSGNVPFDSHLLSTSAEQLAQHVNHWAAKLGNVEGKGSNNWVVAGSDTTSGKSLLANDPHLGLSATAIWHFARPKAPATGGAPGQKAGTGQGGLDDPAAPLIFVTWVDELTRHVVGSRLAAELLKDQYGKRQFRNAEKDLLDRNDATWCGEGGCNQASSSLQAPPLQQREGAGGLV